ncbi:LysE family translocator [Burkholderia cenocepacia]|uniref:LysE family translocator n=1 Tax=Burkholderia cenocepacia TaxID=95486 RepID=UPI000F5A187B|nr:LysE family translocator [Burkholderia cenocepacia]RQU35558.1 LysE family translocator [Burkholderia cenocepacia]
MHTSGSLYGFLVIGGMLAVTPGPNMVYVMSRSIAQGRAAGLISLAGVMIGYLFYMFATAFGITTLFMSVPYAGSVLGAVGATYLLYLAWQAVRPGGRSPFEVKTLPNEQPLRLLAMGATTSVLNPKLAMLFVSLLPQFIDYGQGSVFGQSLFLGSLLIAAFASANGLVAICSGSLATFLHGRPALLLAQRWVMGLILGSLGVQMVIEASKLAGVA